MRVKVDYRTVQRSNYKDFCEKHPKISLTYEEWCNIIYGFNESFRDYLLETGDKAKYPHGFGEFTIIKKKRKHKKILNNKEYINLPVDWVKTKQAGKRIYIMNYHTEGFFFGWKWEKRKAMVKNPHLWYFKPSRVTSRMLAHYVKSDEKYQHLYKEVIS